MLEMKSFISTFCDFYTIVINDNFYFRINTHVKNKTDEAPKSSSGRSRKRKADVAIVSSRGDRVIHLFVIRHQLK